MHEGHRKRMIDKLFTDKDVLSDHELLEILLFFAIPRVNINETAHKLLDSLGTLQNVMNSDEYTLSCIDGIGKNTAAFFVVVNEIYSRIRSSNAKLPILMNYDTCRKYLIDTFRGINEEKFVALFLNKQGGLIMRKMFSSHSNRLVNIDLSELQKGIAAKRPNSVIIAHNHLSDSPLPSVSDDDATQKILSVLKFNNITLDDHIIVSNEQTYSYRTSGKLDMYKRNLDKFRIGN